MKNNLIIAICILFISCGNDSEIESNELYQSTSFNLSEAQEFFEEKYTEYYQLIHSNTDDNIYLSIGEFTPLWDDGKFAQNGSSEYYYVPIITEYRYRAIQSDFNNGKPSAYVTNVEIKLVIEKDIINNQLESYHVLIVPDNEQAEKETTFRRDGALISSGLVIYSKYDNIIGVEEYSNGSVANRVMSSTVSESSELEANQRVINSTISKMKFQYTHTTLNTRSSGEDDVDSEWCDQETILEQDIPSDKPSYAPSVPTWTLKSIL